VFVAHAAFHLATTTHYLFVRRNALLLGEPHVDRAHAPRPAPHRATQRQPARVAATRISSALDERKPPEHYLRVVAFLQTSLYGTEVLLFLRLVLNLDVETVQRDVATYELNFSDAMVAGKLLGL
jgi:hypothetical protein